MIEGTHKNPWRDLQQEGLSPGLRVRNPLLVGHSFTVGSGNMGFPRNPGPNQQSEQGSTLVDPSSLSPVWSQKLGWTSDPPTAVRDCLGVSLPSSVP